MSDPLTIKSSKATKVKAVLVRPGEHVAAGTPLLELFDWEEQLIISKLKRSIAENTIRKDEASGPFVADKLAGLKTALDKATEKSGYAASILQAFFGKYQTGNCDLVRVIDANKKTITASLNVIRQSVELEIFKRNMADAARVYGLVGEILNKEQNYVERYIDRLRIKAPAAGWFTCYVHRGTPVRVGHVLGEFRVDGS